MDVKLDKQSKIPVYLQIVDQLRAQIMCGALPSGSVLPSERGLAQMLEVHRNTVVKAYGELKSDAWIESRQGIGYVVAVPPAAEDGGEGEAGASDKPSRRVNWINEIKDRYLDMEKTFDDVTRQGEIEGLSFDRSRGQFLLLYNRGARIVLGMPKGFYEGYTEEIHEVFVYTRE